MARRPHFLCCIYPQRASNLCRKTAFSPIIIVLCTRLLLYPTAINEVDYSLFHICYCEKHVQVLHLTVLITGWVHRIILIGYTFLRLHHDNSVGHNAIQFTTVIQSLKCQTSLRESMYFDFSFAGFFLLPFGTITQSVIYSCIKS